MRARALESDIDLTINTHEQKAQQSDWGLKYTQTGYFFRFIKI